MISAESNILLEVKKREDKKINSRQALREGLLLGIIYGKEIKENISVVFPLVKFKWVLDKSGEGTLIKLKIEEENDSRDVIIQDVQYHTFTGDVVHVDFLAVSLEEEVEVEVPLEFTGVSPAVKDLGGIFVQSAENVEVRCKARNIPKAITVDISKLADFDDVIYLKDVSLPANIELLDNLDVVVAMIDKPRSEKEIEELEQEAAPDISQVEGVAKEGEETESEEGNTEVKKPEGEAKEKPKE